jgi:hypothetical protein
VSEAAGPPGTGLRRAAVRMDFSGGPGQARVSRPVRCGPDHGGHVRMKRKPRAFYTAVLIFIFPTNAGAVAAGGRVDRGEPRSVVPDCPHQ